MHCGYICSKTGNAVPLQMPAKYRTTMRTGSCVPGAGFPKHIHPSKNLHKRKIGVTDLKDDLKSPKVQKRIPIAKINVIMSLTGRYIKLAGGILTAVKNESLTNTLQYLLGDILNKLGEDLNKLEEDKDFKKQSEDNKLQIVLKMINEAACKENNIENTGLEPLVLVVSVIENLISLEPGDVIKLTHETDNSLNTFFEIISLGSEDEPWVLSLVN
jgi:hypothetical protein